VQHVQVGLQALGHTLNRCWFPVLLLQIEELYKRLDDAVAVISTQNCDLKTQVADVQVRVGTCAGGQNCSCVGLSGCLGLLLGAQLTSVCAPLLLQRETNYLRYVMLTPESKRPRFRRSTQDCSVSKPETCERPVTKKPAQPAVFDPPAACMVSDGVRQYDLTQGSEP
jgi:hypothetical protein